MKRIAHFILLFALWGIVLLAPSCKSNDPEVPSHETAFDKAVGWSRWLRLNHHEPSMWSKSGFEEELDDDDM